MNPDDVKKLVEIETKWAHARGVREGERSVLTTIAVLVMVLLVCVVLYHATPVLFRYLGKCWRGDA